MSRQEENSRLKIRESLLDKLLNNKKVPFHMPGHKRNAVDFLSLYTKHLPYHLDVTEIDGMDDLHQPSGIILENMELAQKLWGSFKSYFLINGSTAGILASIYVSVGLGGKLLLAHNCHKSVYHASEIFDLKLAFLTPKWDEYLSIYTEITAESLEKALKEHTDTRAVLITSPTYEGYHSDITALARVCHARDVFLLVDQAHGAHLGFSDKFASSAVSQGADLVVQSLHKTLYSLTSTAILHQGSTRIDSTELARALSIFQTSSPSYILLASIEHCLKILNEEGEECFERWHKRLTYIDEVCATLKHLHVLGRKLDINFFDKSKVVLDTRNLPYTSQQVASIFRQEYGIEPEMVQYTNLLFLTGLGDSLADVAKLCFALKDFDQKMTDILVSPFTQKKDKKIFENVSLVTEGLKYKPLKKLNLTTTLARLNLKRIFKLTINEALKEEKEELCFRYENQKLGGQSEEEQAQSFLQIEGYCGIGQGQSFLEVAEGSRGKDDRDNLQPEVSESQEDEGLNLNLLGRVASEYIWLYPPGSPFLLPGEKITLEHLRLLSFYEREGLNVIKTGQSKVAHLKVVKEVVKEMDNKNQELN